MDFLVPCNGFSSFFKNQISLNFWRNKTKSILTNLKSLLWVFNPPKLTLKSTGSMSRFLWATLGDANSFALIRSPGNGFCPLLNHLKLKEAWRPSPRMQVSSWLTACMLCFQDPPTSSIYWGNLLWDRDVHHWSHWEDMAGKLEKKQDRAQKEYQLQTQARILALLLSSSQSHTLLSDPQFSHLQNGDTNSHLTGLPWRFRDIRHRKSLDPVNQ